MKQCWYDSIHTGKKDTRSIFICVMLLEFVLVLGICFFSRGSYSKYFFFVNYTDEEVGMGYREIGMDFFNSIYTLFSKNPYGESASNYPPLASLLFLALQHFLPKEITSTFPIDAYPWTLRGTNYDLRTYQQSMLLFILFLIIFVVLFLYAIEKYFKDYPHAKMFAIACCLTHGVIFGIERGNIILLALLLTFVFLVGYDSEKPVIRELSLISLAIAAGLKLYPALFGILLIREKKWKLAIRTMVYGILAFLLPFLAFGGLQTLETYIVCLKDFSETHNTLGSYGLPLLNRALSHIVSYFSSESQDQIYEIISPVFTAVIAVILVRGIFVSQYRWEQSLFIATAIVLFQPSDTYTLSFYLLPFLLLCKESPIISDHMTERICLLILLSIVPLLPISPDYPKVTVSILVALAAQFAVVTDCLFVSKERKYLQR